MAVLKLYADVPAMRLRQLAGDGACLLWVLLWCWLATFAHAAVSALAEPARRVEAGAGDLAEDLQRAGERAGDLPLLGRQLGGSISGAAEGATAVAVAGGEQVALLEELALLVAVVVAVGPSVLALAVRIPSRLRYARRAAAVQRLAAGGEAPLLALRALVHQEPQALARLGADPLTAWRAGDPQVVVALADMELRSLGLRPPGVSGRCSAPAAGTGR